jgi:hypothetical protein
MESSGFPSCIHVSEACRRRLPDAVGWVSFGRREIKGPIDPMPLGLL